MNKTVINFIGKRLKELSEDLTHVEETILNWPDKLDFKPGYWVQAHTGGSEPVYAKIKKFDGNHVILEGLFDYSVEPKKPLAIPKDWCLAISPELCEFLEYANKNNSQLTAKVSSDE